MQRVAKLGDLFVRTQVERMRLEYGQRPTKKPGCGAVVRSCLPGSAERRPAAFCLPPSSLANWHWWGNRNVGIPSWNESSAEYALPDKDIAAARSFLSCSSSYHALGVAMAGIYLLTKRQHQPKSALRRKYGV